MQCKVFNGIIAKKPKCLHPDGLGTYTFDCKKSNLKVKSLYDVELGRRFNTLVIDCEGCFISFFNIFKKYILQNITTIILEVDRINHDEILNILLNNNFKIVEKMSHFISKNLTPDVFILSRATQ